MRGKRANIKTSILVAYIFQIAQCADVNECCARRLPAPQLNQHVSTASNQSCLSSMPLQQIERLPQAGRLKVRLLHSSLLFICLAYGPARDSINLVPTPPSYAQKLFFLSSKVKRRFDETTMWRGSRLAILENCSAAHQCVYNFPA